MGLENKVPNLLPFDGEAYFLSSFIETVKATNFFLNLHKDVKWQQESVKIFGKSIPQPRLTAWFSDNLQTYSYSGIQMKAEKLTNELLSIRQMVQEITGMRFNSALLNLYRDGNDSVGWHRDNEKELGTEPVIASVSLGAERMFQLRNYTNKKLRVNLQLTNGSLLLMKGSTQANWEHRIPKTTSITGPRINITFRLII
jgi:alkylated DNA repair dioxygenase AlkB